MRPLFLTSLPSVPYTQWRGKGLAPDQMVLDGPVGVHLQGHRGPRQRGAELDEGCPAHPAGSGHPGAAAAGLDEGHLRPPPLGAPAAGPVRPRPGKTACLGPILRVVEPMRPPAGLAVVDDAAVLHLHPGAAAGWQTGTGQPGAALPGRRPPQAAGGRSGRSPLSNGIFVAPAIASDGIHESDVTVASVRMTQKVGPRPGRAQG